MAYQFVYSKELMHYGVKGQQWGKRQYQNEDGSLTDLGRSHYGYGNTAKNTADIARQQTASNFAKYGNGHGNFSTAKVTTSKNGNTSGLMTMDQIKKINESNAAKAASTSTEEEKKTTKKKGSGSKKGSSSKKKSNSDTNSSNDPSKKTDMDIVKSALGKNFDSVKEKVAKKFAETGKTTLTNEEIKEILGKDYESVRDNVKKQVEERDKAKKEKKSSKTSTDSSEDTKETKSRSQKTIKDYAKKALAGELGTDEEMKETLGSDYTKVKSEMEKIERNRSQVTKKAKSIKHSNGYGYAFVSSSEYLKHHGVEGQKWGKKNGPPYPLGASDHSASERKAGTSGWTNEAKAEERKRSGGNYQSQSSEKKSIDKKKVIKAVAITAAVAGGVAFMASPIGRKCMSTAVSKLPEVPVAVGKVTGRAAGKGAAKVVKALSKASDAALEGALGATGAIAIAQLAKKLPTDESVPYKERVKNKITLEGSTKAIESATNIKSGSSSSSGSKSSGNIDTDAISKKVGKPTNNYVDRSSSEYQGLFKDKNDNQRSEDQRATIKSMAKAGYDVNQIKDYLWMEDHGSAYTSYKDDDGRTVHVTGKIKVK